jgi:hypothetical protein
MTVRALSTGTVATEDLIEVHTPAVARHGRRIAHVQFEAEGVEGPDDEPELGGGLATFELVNPLPGDTRAVSQRRLGQAELMASSADDGCEVMDGVGLHGLLPGERTVTSCRM